MDLNFNAKSILGRCYSGSNDIDLANGGVRFCILDFNDGAQVLRVAHCYQ